jgi:uncharacterized repeat protein (TIGR01451 family)
MKRLFVFLIFGLVVFVTPGTSHAQIQFLNNWTIDIDGPEGFDPVTINEFIDIIGAGYIVNSFTTAQPSLGDLGTFDEFSVFVSSHHDFGQPFPWFYDHDHEITGIFHGSGTVELGGPLGIAPGGTLEIYADLGKAVAFATDTADADPSIYGANEQTLIAVFEVESGDGLVDSTGVPNGQITVIFKATFLAPGVWADSNGTDLSTMTSLALGFSTTNASFVANPTPAMITDLAGEFAGVSSPPNTPPGDMFVGANGQFRLFVEEECNMSIGDLVWHDQDRDGIQDAGEPGIDGVTVNLKDDQGTEIATTTTGPDGFYQFTGLCAGDYTVEVNETTLPPNFVASACDQGMDDTADNDCSPEAVTLPDDNFNNPTIDFGFITPYCTLKVTKTCFVPSPPSGVFECDKPIDVLTMIWDGTEAVRIKAWKGAVGSTLLADVDNIAVGDEVTVSGFAGSPNDVIWEIFEAGTSDNIGESTFHLSCSDDNMNGLEDCGKRQGDGKDKSGYINDWLLEGMVDAKNSFNCTFDPISHGADECEFFIQEATLCEKRPTAISLRYTGGDCSQTSHNQDPGKVSCTDFSPLVEPVRIVMSKTDGSNVSLDTGGAVVQFGDIVKATAANAGRAEFDSESLVQVFDENNVLLQEIVFHTSCSQHLSLGDQFGSVEVVGFENADQGQVQLGVEVEYTYKIKNMGDVDVFNLTVEDTLLGTVPGSPIASLGPDETITLTATAFVEKTTTNTVTVTGETIFGDECSAMDRSTVTAVGPPPCTVSPVEFKISDDKIEWKLSNDGDKVVTIDSIEIRWPEALGDLKKVKREKDTIFEGPVPPPLVLINSDDMMTSDLKKRQIKPGESNKVTFEFAAKASTIPGDYEITVNFAERCSATFEPEAIPFMCSDVKPIDSLTMIWNGTKGIASICVYRDKYDPNDTTKNIMYTIDGPIVTDDEVTADGYAAADAKNDVDWVITFSDGTEGVSRFHRSCSDDDMNGPEDCGKAEGNSKDDNTGFINDWIFEGMAGNGLTLDCTP